MSVSPAGGSVYAILLSDKRVTALVPRWNPRIGVGGTRKFLDYTLTGTRGSVLSWAELDWSLARQTVFSFGQDTNSEGLVQFSICVLTLGWCLPTISGVHQGLSDVTKGIIRSHSDWSLWHRARFGYNLSCS